MTNSIGEIEDNDVLLIIGSNATEAHPIIGNKMKKAIQKGARAIVIDPRKTELATMAKYHLPLNSGTDACLINGLMHIIIENEWHDEEYIKERCIGFESLSAFTRCFTQFSGQSPSGYRRQTAETARPPREAR